MKLYKITIELPYFHGYPEPERSEFMKAFAESVKAWFDSLPNVGVESWSGTFYGDNVIVVDQQNLAQVLTNVSRFKEFKSHPNSDDTACFIVKKVEEYYSSEPIEAKLISLIERMELAALRLESGDPDRNPANPGWNEKTSSPLSGFHLHNCNDLLLLEDCCTDALQGHLDEGWRIIAVTTQEQRRPDYILARYNNTYNGNRGKANRS